MATIQLSDYECRRDLLPDVCIFCGAPAATRLRRQFSWTPGWVWILLLVHLIILIIVAAIVTKRMTVRVPVCEEHAGYWRRRNVRIISTLVAVIAFSIAAALYADAQPAADDLLPFVCGGSILLGAAWLIMAAVLINRGVRPSQITDDTIKLIGVDEDFAEALRVQRARQREGRRDDSFGDERDDYDDEPIDRPRRRRVRTDFDDPD